MGHTVCQRSAGPVVVDTGQRLVDADDTVGRILADKLKNKAAFRLGKRRESEPVAVNTIECREVAVQVYAPSVIATVVGDAVRVGNG